MNTKSTILNKLKIPPLIFFFPVILGLIIEMYLTRIETKNLFFIYLGTIICIIGIMHRIIHIISVIGIMRNRRPKMDV